MGNFCIGEQDLAKYSENQSQKVQYFEQYSGGIQNRLNTFQKDKNTFLTEILNSKQDDQDKTQNLDYHEEQQHDSALFKQRAKSLRSLKLKDKFKKSTVPQQEKTLSAQNSKILMKRSNSSDKVRLNSNTQVITKRRSNSLQSTMIQGMKGTRSSFLTKIHLKKMNNQVFQKQKNEQIQKTETPQKHSQISTYATYSTIEPFQQTKDHTNITRLDQNITKLQIKIENIYKKKIKLQEQLMESTATEEKLLIEEKMHYEVDLRIQVYKFRIEKMKQMRSDIVKNLQQRFQIKQQNLKI